MKIKITEFAKRHFNPKFGGTKILDYTVEEFESVINTLINETSAFIDGYAPFCKLFPIKNFTKKAARKPTHFSSGMNCQIF